MIRVVETRSILEGSHADSIETLNEESLKSDLRELLRRTVTGTLNDLLEKADAWWAPSATSAPPSARHTAPVPTTGA